MKTSGSRLSRRKLLGWTALGVGGLGAVAASALNRNWFAKDARGKGSWWDRSDQPLERAGYNEWNRHVGSAFELHTETGQSSFKLVSVTPLAQRGERPHDLARDRGFTVTFEGDAGTTGNRTYTARHATGSLEIFMGAANPSASTSTLTAVFN
jgi:hypothetical protein